MWLYSPLIRIGHFLDIYSGSLKIIFQFILILETISDKNCETRNISLLIQCWLQVCSFQACTVFEKRFWDWQTFSQRAGTVLGIFKQVKYFFRTS